MGISQGKEVQFFVNEKGGGVSGLLLKPSNANSLLVLAHGAGAGMRHRFMEDVARKLAERGIATLRYQFPYMEKRTKRPDSEAVLTDTVRAAIGTAKKQAGNLPIFAGGKSMGGCTLQTQAKVETGVILNLSLQISKDVPPVIVDAGVVRNVTDGVMPCPFSLRLLASLRPFDVAQDMLCARIFFSESGFISRQDAKAQNL